MPKILHVDDDLAWTEIVGSGVPTDQYNNLLEAQKAYASKEYDVVIVDGYIEVEPGNGDPDGVEWAKKLSAEGQPVVLLSRLEPGQIPDDSNIAYLNKVRYSIEDLRLVLGLE